MKGDLYDFLVALGHRESENKYDVKNKWGYMGRWQFGKPRLYDVGFSLDGYAPKGQSPKRVITWEQFKSDSLMQDMAVLKHVRLWREYYKKNEYIGQTILGVKITLSGLVAGAHLKGAGGVSQFLKGENNADALGTTILSYIEKFGDYDLQE